MFDPRWLMRLKRWTQNPPSARQVVLIGALLFILLMIAAVEHYVGWPEALTGTRIRPPSF